MIDEAAFNAIKEDRNRIMAAYDLLYAEHMRNLAHLHTLERQGPRPTTKQYFLTAIVQSPIMRWWMSVRAIWNRAERIYAEGVRRGHYTADKAP